MKRLKRLVFLMVFAALGATFVVPPLTVLAANPPHCPAGPTFFGRGECNGYFTNQYDYISPTGLDVDNIIDNGGASLLGVRTANDFISTIQRLLFVGGKDEIGAAFIVDTMLQKPGSTFGSSSAGIIFARNNFALWSNKVTYYDHGINGTRVDWNPSNFAQRFPASGSSFQDSAHSRLGASDEIFYIKTSAEVNPAITFTNADGTTYVIKKNCANLIGNPILRDCVPSSCALPSFNLQPIVNATIIENGVAIGGSVAQVGDTVTFNYSVQNQGAGASTGTNCTVYGDSHPGYYAPPTPADKGTIQPVGTGCPRNFAANSTTGVGSQSFVINTAAQSICRSLYVSPATYSGGELGSESCIQVAARPYVQVFGADVSVGNSFGRSCTQNSSAGIAAWNRESGGNYAGAGTQFAAQTLANILDFASAQNTAGASAPYGLSFANTNRSSSIFGGQFGSLGDCLPDYYGGKPATAMSKTAAQLASLDTVGSGVFQETGDVTLSGNLTASQNTVIYVKGNVYINGNITYNGAWPYDKIPLLEIVAQGNIYINSGVTQIAGTFISQANAGSGGAIYTCTTGSTPLALSGGMYNTCLNPLTINGQFIANQVYFLRTSNSLSDSLSNHTAGSSKAAEIFNFTPANWITQPPQGSNTNTSTVDSYDSVSALPPVL